MQARELHGDAALLSQRSLFEANDTSFGTNEDLSSRHRNCKVYPNGRAGLDMEVSIQKSTAGAYVAQMCGFAKAVQHLARDLRRYRQLNAGIAALVGTLGRCHAHYL